MTSCCRESSDSPSSFYLYKYKYRSERNRLDKLTTNQQWKIVSRGIAIENSFCRNEIIEQQKHVSNFLTNDNLYLDDNKYSCKHIMVYQFLQNGMRRTPKAAKNTWFAYDASSFSFVIFLGCSNSHLFWIYSVEGENKFFWILGIIPSISISSVRTGVGTWTLLHIYIYIVSSWIHWKGTKYVFEAFMEKLISALNDPKKWIDIQNKCICHLSSSPGGAVELTSYVLRSNPKKQYEEVCVPHRRSRIHSPATRIMWKRWWYKEKLPNKLAKSGYAGAKYIYLL